MAAGAFHGNASQLAQGFVDARCPGEPDCGSGDAPGLLVPSHQTSVSGRAREHVREGSSLVELSRKKQALDHPQIMEMHPHVISRLDRVVETNER
jgi:hypothetical protein